MAGQFPKPAAAHGFKNIRPKSSQLCRSKTGGHLHAVKVRRTGDAAGTGTRAMNRLLYFFFINLKKYLYCSFLWLRFTHHEIITTLYSITMNKHTAFNDA
jgi:hypothetical protein